MTNTSTSTTDANRSGNGNLITIELTEDLKQLGVITNFIFDRKSNLLILSLNHKDKKKTIISPVFQHDWIKTTQKFKGHITSKGVNEEHANMLCDLVDNNYERILDINDNGNTNEGDEEQQTRKPKVFIRKYTCNGTLGLYESVVIAGQSSFLHLVDHKLQYTPTIESANKIFYPSDTTDTQNPLPYIFNSTEELLEYLDLASKETFETLHCMVETVYKKYVNAEEYYLVILAADTIYSYFQDRFGTTHYNIFVGDNGSGKNSALLVYRYLGYRVFYVTAASAANYYTFLGETEEGQGTTAEDEADDIGYDRDKQKIFKTGYCSGGFVPKVDLPNGGGRRQDSWLTYCHKWMAMESLPDQKKIKGILDRSLVYNFVAGDVQYNIKDIIRYAGDPKLKPLYDELVHIRKLLFAFRMIHYSDVIPDIKLNIVHRSAELTKPLLRLFSYQNNSPTALERIRLALSKFIERRNDLKRNSIESKLRDAINNLVEERKKSPDLEKYKGLEQYSFYNEENKKFLRFSEKMLTNNKADPCHSNNLSFKNCMLIVPGSHNWECVKRNNNIPGSTTEVKIIQRWDGNRPAINWLLRHFRRYLIQEKIDNRVAEIKKTRSSPNAKTTRLWIEILLDTPMGDYRKEAIRRIIAPYLINIKKLTYDDAFNVIKNWLKRCDNINPLDFNANVKIKDALRAATRIGYLPIGFSDLKSENVELYRYISNQFGNASSKPHKFGGKVFHD